MPKGRSTILDLDNEIKLSSKKNYYKESNEKIKKLKNSIERWEFKNRKINSERKKLKKEQITRGTSKQRIQQIDKILKGIEPIKVEYNKQSQKKYKLKQRDEIYLTPLPISPMKNELNMISGKDFDINIGNGIGKQKKIKHSKLVKIVKSGKSITEHYLNEMISDLKNERKKLEQFIKSNKKKLTKKRLKSKKNQLNGLKKLLNVAKFNLKTFKTGEKDYDEIGEDREKGEYPIMINFIGNQIRINA